MPPRTAGQAAATTETCDRSHQTPRFRVTRPPQIQIPMRIAFDLDGVLADLETVLAEAAQQRIFAVTDPVAPASAAEVQPGDDPGGMLQAASGDPNPDDEPVPPLVHQLSTAQQRRLWRSVLETDNFWETLNETESGVIARLAVLALERRWEVIFVTQRPTSAGDTCQLQSQRWLARHGFALPSVFVVRGSRGKVASALDLDVVVDDRPDNCLDVVLDSRARAFLVWRGDPSAPAALNAKRLNINVVGSVRECLDILAAERVEKTPGLLDRLKRLIGSYCG